jgi:hypothetical protein
MLIAPNGPTQPRDGPKAKKHRNPYSVAAERIYRGGPVMWRACACCIKAREAFSALRLGENSKVSSGYLHGTEYSTVV